MGAKLEGSAKADAFNANKIDNKKMFKQGVTCDLDVAPDRIIPV
jgi:hypothetical protein